jgi:electron transfer flavoprotein beta subunit
MSRIALLVSAGRNPVSGSPRACRNDAVALELARSLGGDLTLLHAGDPDNPGLTDYLAYGAAAVDVLPIGPGADILPALAQRLAGFDLILCGSRAETGEESGMLPYLLAETLALPVVGQALSLVIDGTEAEITQFLPKGARRRVRVVLPAVVCVHPLAPMTPRYAQARKISGRIVRLPAPDAAAMAECWRVEPAAKRPVRLRAQRKEAGHNRMLSAIAPAAKGGEILREGSAAEKAQAILTYLRRHRLTER